MGVKKEAILLGLVQKKNQSDEMLLAKAIFAHMTVCEFFKTSILRQGLQLSGAYRLHSRPTNIPVQPYA
jgi:hypothetical protein